MVGQVSMNPTRYLNNEEHAWLVEYALGWKGMGEECPTCFGLPHEPGEYRYAGEVHACDLDVYGRHTQRWLFDLYSLAGIPHEFMTLDWAIFPDEDGGYDVKAFMDDFLARYKLWRAKGRGFVLSGSFGTGKTWACCHVAKELAKLDKNVFFIPFWELVALYDQPHDRRDALKGRCLDAELLVIDDVLLGRSEAQQDLFQTKLEEVVRQRTHANLPTLLTTNLSEKKFAAIYPRVYTVLSGKNEWLELNGGDYRPTKKAAAERTVNSLEVEPIT